MPVTDSEGQLLQPDDDGCFSGSGGVSIIAAADERLGATMQRHRIVGGRAADASRADEVVLSAQTARDHGIVVGDRILIYTDPEDCGDPAAWGEPTEVTVVGLTVLPGDQAGQWTLRTGGIRLTSVDGRRASVTAASTSPSSSRLGATVADLRTDDVPALDVGIDYADFEADVELACARMPAALARRALGGLAGSSS